MLDANPRTSAGAIPAGATVTVAASSAIFNAGMVGQQIRLRANANSLSCYSWAPGQLYRVGAFVESVGNMYVSTQLGTDKDGSNPPVQPSGSQSDGDNVFGFLHDGAGIVSITGFTDSTHVTGTVVAACPIASATATTYWALGAYSPATGWPRAWPAIREERLVGGSTATNLDILDLTETAGFDTVSETFHPGTGLGSIVAHRRDPHPARRRQRRDLLVRCRQLPALPAPTTPSTWSPAACSTSR